MATFTPPTTDDVPPVEVTTRGLARRLFSRFRPLTSGVNVFILNDGTVTETDPYTTYENGVIDEEAWSRVRRTFWGGHVAQPVTEEEQALLEGAGYEVDE